MSGHIQGWASDILVYVLVIRGSCLLIMLMDTHLRMYQINHSLNIKAIVKLTMTIITRYRIGHKARRIYPELSP